MGAVVGDVGSYSCKMGFAGEDFPRAYFPSVRSRLRVNRSVWIDWVVCSLAWL